MMKNINEIDDWKVYCPEKAKCVIFGDCKECETNNECYDYDVYASCLPTCVQMHNDMTNSELKDACELFNQNDIIDRMLSRAAHIPTVDHRIINAAKSFADN